MGADENSLQAMNDSGDYQAVLQNRGIPLCGLGINGIALTRVDALIAVDLLRLASVAILGGDVYFNCSGSIETAYANWHSEPRQGEGREDFARRSCLEAEAHISQFPLSGSPPLFALVVDR